MTSLKETSTRYSIAVLSVVAGVALRGLLGPALGPNVPYITFFPAVMFAAWFGGFGPGLLATGFGLLSAVYFAISPFPTERPADAVGAVVFVGVSIFICVLNEALRRARARSDARLGELAGETERRGLVERALADSKREAERARDLLQLALDAGKIGVWDWDMIHDRIVWSEIMFDIHGMQRGSAPTGVNDYYNKLVHPEDRERLRAFMDAAMQDAPIDVEYRVIRGDGSVIWVATTGSLHRNEVRKPVRMVGSMSDVTERKRAEEEVRRSNLDLTRANRELEEFAYVASHDLQEPLRMVNIYTQLILREMGGEPPKLAHYAHFVQQGVTRMDGLIHDLLDFSRVVHAEPAPEGSADLSASLAEATSVLKDRIEGCGAQIAAEALPTVRGDTAQLAHVFQNLLSNALKYCRKDAVPRIAIHAEQRDGEWVISVEDDGIGFEQQFAERIFGLFKRLHRDEYPGTGLGLAICKRIVERYGGRIWAEGRPGAGAIFFFSLPAADRG